MKRQRTVLTLVLLAVTTLVTTSQLADAKIKPQSQTTSSRSSSPSFGYTFQHYRRPRYSHSRSKSVSTYNGHPHFSYGKVTWYHPAPAITTYDAGLGSYGPSYDSMGGYKDPGYKDEPRVNDHDDRKCPHLHHDEEYEHPKRGEEIDYKPALKPTYEEIAQENQGYGCAGKICIKDVSHENHYYPVYKGGRFVYSVYTDHGWPVYHKPTSYNNHYSTKPHPVKTQVKPVEHHSHDTSYNYHYSTKPHPVKTEIKYKYPTNYQHKPSEHPEKAKNSLKYPSEDEIVMSNVYDKPKYPTNYEHPAKMTEYPTKYYKDPTESDSYEERKGSKNDGDHFSMSQSTPHSSFSMQVHIPWSTFKCNRHQHPGFYADVQSHCSIWHYCQPDGRQDSFKCIKGTLFNQKSLTCDWWFNVDCPSSPRYYNLNRQLYHTFGETSETNKKSKPKSSKTS